MPERQCQGCQPAQKAQWGCEKEAPFASTYFDGEPMLRCPLRPKLENPVWFAEVSRAYRWREHGFLPGPGTWQDQSVKFLQVCDTIDGALAEADKEERDQRRAASEREARLRAVAGGGGKPTPTRPGIRRRR